MENAPIVPESWDMMSDDQQQSALTTYIEDTKSDYLDNEIENWRENDGPDDARYKAAEEFMDGTERGWAQDVLTDLREKRRENEEPDFPYTDKQLLDAIDISHDTGHYPAHKGTTIELDEAVLEPDLAKNQQNLGLTHETKLKKPSGEGEETVTETIEGPTSKLTADMRIQITEAIEEAFGEHADSVLEDMDPPDYLADNVEEFQKESWDGMDDDSKFDWTSHNTNIIKDAEQEYNDYVEAGGVTEGGQIDKLPETFDPLQDNGDDMDYRRTQRLAKFMSVNRAAGLITERGVKIPDLAIDPGEGPEAVKAAVLARVEKIDTQLWTSWKGSSTSSDGWLLQVAAHDELGGRLNEFPTKGAYGEKDLTFDGARSYADERYKQIGGYEGVKAYVRAKWETTQYLLDKADIHQLQLYRAINMKRAEGPKAQLEQAQKTAKTVNIGGDDFKALPDLAIKRNGAASTSVDRGVPNGWNGNDGRVVIRAEVPRTAVLSVPAYGINVQKEREVVVTGTAWTGWDAWEGKAPDFEKQPITHHGVAS